MAASPTVTAAASGLDQPQRPPASGEILALIRATLIAVDQANRTGNYTVLRQLASQHFQDANSAEQLAEIFKGWRLSGMNLTALTNSPISFSRAPVVDRKGRLSLAGTLTGQTVQVSFELAFNYEADRGWALYEIKLTASPATPERATSAQPARGQAVEPAGAPAITPPDITEFPVPRRWPGPRSGR
ncbi:hypothetical protein [Rhodoligotrophos defluvii]|uniref:hypothetical protein n=1 Tax=Rhodoligotrophos defluvii TaxID=2561934 RepID=UPI0010C9436B|nr:hypothetical protein [Rhodoligotrophos defluvii]